jgi:hypothetical protein
MRILFEGSATDAFSLIMANDISVYLSLSIMAVTTGLVYYLVGRILDWSGNKPLPRVVQSSAFKLLLVSSVMAITLLLLRGIDLIGLFLIATEPIVWIVDEYAPVVIVGLATAVMLIVVQWLRAR